MHICIVVRHFYPFARPSGVTSFVRELIFEIHKYRNIKISIICLRGLNEAAQYQYKKIRIHKFGQLNIVEYSRILSSIKPDKLVFVSSISSGILLPFWWELLRAVSRRKEITFVQTTNFSVVPNKWLVKPLMSKYSKLIVCSDQLQKDYLNNYDINPSIIYPGVDVAYIKQKYCEREKQLNRIAFMGHVSYTKGTDRFMRLATCFPHLNFHVIAGKSRNTKKDSLLYETLLAQSGEAGNLQFTRAIDQPLLPLSECQLMVLPYRSGATVLGVAQSAIEAMAMGIPVIGTKNSALMSLIVNGKNGYYCETEDSFVDRIRSLVQDPSLLQELSEGATKTAELKFNISTITDSYLALL